jgi:hypothetical protein
MEMYYWDDSPVKYPDEKMQEKFLGTKKGYHF